jgi:hypothetical protein
MPITFRLRLIKPRLSMKAGSVMTLFEGMRWFIAARSMPHLTVGRLPFQRP